jgi:Skp family chaperone for outer membrane proteins
MDQQARTAMEESIMELESKLNQYQQEMNRPGGTLEQKYGQLVKPIIDHANDIIHDIRVSEGYTMVLDYDTDAVLDADESLDISEQVLEKMQATPMNQGQ